VLDMRAEQCSTCHAQANPPEDLTTSQMVRRVAHGTSDVLGITQVIHNEPECSSASCHVHQPAQKLLGLLDISMQLEPYERARRASALRGLAVGLAAILLSSAITFVATQRIVHRPVRQLIRGAKALAAGDHSVRVPEESSDEMGTLARAFNRMSRDLEKAHSELLEWAQTLEQRVQVKTVELERAQQQILQVERMASLGRLSAVVAHEINNPLASVVTYAKILVRRTRDREKIEDYRENQQYLESIISEATRCGDIVSQLLSFARQPTGEFIQANLNSIVERVLFLTKHKLEMGELESAAELDASLPMVRLDPARIQQALMALIINACEVMEPGGRVVVRTRQGDGGVVLEVEDNGPGMTPEVAERAFEPFFSTKSQGSGLGLGLAVVYSIVKSHEGRIDLVTAPGAGCRFSIFLPSGQPVGRTEVQG